MWSTIEVDGHPCEIYEPSQPSEHGYALIYLHGVSGEWLNDKAEFTEQFEKHGIRVIGPRTKRSWWSNKICQEFDLKRSAEAYVRDNILTYVENQWGVSAPRVGLLGTSMGGQGDLRLSYKYPGVFPI